MLHKSGFLSLRVLPTPFKILTCSIATPNLNLTVHLLPGLKAIDRLQQDWKLFFSTAQNSKLQTK